MAESEMSSMGIVTCLYCGRVTGTTREVNRKTVCSACRWRPDRYELLEVLSGQSPWSRPLSFFANGKALPDNEAQKAQAAWDREQNWIRAHNDAHLGCSCSPEEIAAGHRRQLACLPECGYPQRQAVLSALPSGDRTAYKDYLRDLGERIVKELK